MTEETILTVESIAEALVKNGIFLSEGEVTGYDIDFARAIEQAVLNSSRVQFLLTALEESNSLLVACAHEKRPWGEIEAQLGMNRDALIDMGRHAE